MDYFLAVVVAEGFLDLAGGQAADALDVLCAVVGDAAGYAIARTVHYEDSIAAAKVSGDAAHPGGQQAAVMLRQGGHRAVVNGHLAAPGNAGLREQIQQPALAGFQLLFGRLEKGAYRLT